MVTSPASRPPNPMPPSTCSDGVPEFFERDILLTGRGSERIRHATATYVNGQLTKIVYYTDYMEAPDATTA